VGIELVTFRLWGMTSTNITTRWGWTITPQFSLTHHPKEEEITEQLIMDSLHYPTKLNLNFQNNYPCRLLGENMFIFACLASGTHSLIFHRINFT
jgi:hypothetical protein